MRLLIFLGPPGVGKGTAAKRLVDSLGFHWLSTGDMLRAAKRSGSEFGQSIVQFIDAGRLVPDAMMIKLVEDQMEMLPPGTKLLLDGFPRTRPQAAALDQNLAGRGNQVDLVIELQAEEQELIRRIQGRSLTDGRADDTFQTLQHRFQVFQSQTAPLADYYRQQGKLQTIRAMGTPDEVFNRISRCVQNHFGQDATQKNKSEPS